MNFLGRVEIKSILDDSNLVRHIQCIIVRSQADISLLGSIRPESGEKNAI